MQSRELYDQTVQLAELGSLSAQQRLEQVLWRLLASTEVKETRKEVRLLLPLKHWEIAQLIAVTPAYLSRLFKQLERAGTLRRSKGWLIFPNSQVLEPAHKFQRPSPKGPHSA